VALDKGLIQLGVVAKYGVAFLKMSCSVIPRDKSARSKPISNFSALTTWLYASLRRRWRFALTPLQAPGSPHPSI
jgi:hypothetical protein